MPAGSAHRSEDRPLCNRDGSRHAHHPVDRPPGCRLHLPRALVRQSTERGRRRWVLLLWVSSRPERQPALGSPAATEQEPREARPTADSVAGAR